MKNLLRLLTMLCIATLASFVSAAWRIDYKYQYSFNVTFPYAGGGGMGSYGDTFASEEWSSTLDEILVDNYSDEIGSTPYPLSGNANATVWVRVKWDGDINLAPQSVYLKLDSSSSSNISVEQPGSVSKPSATNGLDHPAVVNQQLLYASANSSGVRYVKCNPLAGEAIIPIKLTASYSGTGTEGSSGEIMMKVEASISDRYVGISSDKDISYYRVPNKKANGFFEGLAIANEMSPTGTMYGDTAMRLYKSNDQQSWAQSTNKYTRVKGGGWPTDIGLLTNEWWSANPTDYWRDSAVAEYEWINPSALFGRTTSPSVDDIAKGKTAVQTIRLRLTDETNKNALIVGEAMYFMTMHAPRQKEDQYKAPYKDYLHRTASGVSGSYQAVEVGHGVANTTNKDSEVTFTVTTEKSYTYEAKVEGTVSADIAELLTLQFGAAQTLTSGTTKQVGQTFKITLPAGKSVTYFALARGTVTYYNWSRWINNGYSGDDHVTDVRPGNVDIVPAIYSNGSSPAVPYL